MGAYSHHRAVLMLPGFVMPQICYFLGSVSQVCWVLGLFCPWSVCRRSVMSQDCCVPRLFCPRSLMSLTALCHVCFVLDL